MNILTGAGRLRIGSVDDVRGLFESVRNEYSSIGLARSRIGGLFDGNRPFNQSDLNKEGLGWFPNINTREAKSALKKQISGFWELEMEVPNLITLRVVDSNLLGGGVAYNDWLNVIEDEYSRLIRSWYGYELNRIMGIREKLLYGISAHFWEDDYDWRFKTLKASQIYFLMDADSDISRLDCVFIWHSYRLFELMDIVDSGEDGELFGWNIGVLKKVIKNCVDEVLTQEDRYRLNTYEAIQQAIKDKAFSYSYTQIPAIPVVDMFIRADDNMWSRYRFTSNKIRDEGERDFLLVQEGKWDDIGKVISFDLYEVGDNTIRSVKGLGHELFTIMDIDNRLVSNILGSGMIGNSIMLKPLNASARRGLSITKRGPLMLLPEGMDVIQQNMQPNIEGSLAIRNLMMQIANNNVGLYNIGYGSRYRSRDEVNIEALRNAQFEKSDQAFAYIFRDFFHRELFRRVLTDINDIPDVSAYKQLRAELQAFRDRCIKRGVPNDVLKAELYDVGATRAIGYGSPISKEIATSKLLEIMPYLDDVGRRNVILDRVSSLVGSAMASRYVSSTSSDRMKINETSIAVLENNDIEAGSNVVVGVDQMHNRHIDTHMLLVKSLLEKGGEIMNSMADGMPIMRSLTIVMRHIREHIDEIRIELDRKRYEEIYNEINKFVVNLMKQLEARQQKLMQINQQMLGMAQNQKSVELQAKLEEVAQNAYVKMRDKEMQNEIRKYKALADIELKKARAQAEIDIANAKTQADISRENAKTINKLGQ